MEQMKIKNHLSEECEHTVISCKYTSIGCEVKLKRKDMRAHEQDDKAHLNKALDTVVELQTKVQSNEDRLSQSPMAFRVTGFQDNNEIFLSPSFYTSPNGYHMGTKVYANGTGDGKGSHVSVFAHVIKVMMN